MTDEAQQPQDEKQPEQPEQTEADDMRAKGFRKVRGVWTR